MAYATEINEYSPTAEKSMVNSPCKDINFFACPLY